MSNEHKQAMIYTIFTLPRSINFLSLTAIMIPQRALGGNDSADERILLRIK